jgi:hypothetical protein
MPGSTKISQSTRAEVQESLDNLRRNIGESADRAQIKRYRAMITLLLRRYGHLGVR